MAHSTHLEIHFTSENASVYDICNLQLSRSAACRRGHLTVYPFVIIAIRHAVQKCLW